MKQETWAALRFANKECDCDQYVRLFVLEN